MADINMWALAGTGFVAGAFGSMLGIGGGIFIVPILTLALGVPMQNAIGSSLVAIVINALTGTSVFIRNHMTNLKLGILLSCALVPGALAGALLGGILSDLILRLIFAALLVYIAYHMFPKKPPTHKYEAAVQEKEHAPHAWLDESYYDPALKQEISYSVHRPVTGLTTGFFSGVISSLLGVGGGAINVPVMNLVMKVPIKAAIATSGLLLCFTTMMGAIVYAVNGFVQPQLTAPLIIGVFLGAQLGSLLAHRVHGTMLLRVFTVILIVAAVSMVLKALNLLG